MLIAGPLSVLSNELSRPFVHGAVAEGTTWRDASFAADACGDLAVDGVLVDLFVSITQGVVPVVGSPWFGHDVVAEATRLVTVLATAVVLRALALDWRA